MQTFAEKLKQTQSRTSSESSSAGRADARQGGVTSGSLLVRHAIVNRGTGDSLQSDTEEGSANPTIINSPHLARDVRRIGIAPSASASIQAHKPIDGYELETDHVAEQAMRKPQRQFKSSCPCGGACPKCRTEQKHLPYGLSQLNSDPASDVGQTAVPPAVYEGLRSPGQPIDPGTRSFMEQRFGHDFSRVRLHTGSEAEMGASAVSARAYTIGNDIVLGSGEYSPQTLKGRHLLAHEMTHVLQQTGGARPASGISAPDDAFERLADTVADAIVSGRSARPMLSSIPGANGSARPIPSVMRQTDPRPNPAEYEFVPIEKGGTWDAVSILDRISQREYTQTRITKSQPAEGSESDPYRCGPSAVLATAIVAGPKAVMQLCVNLYKRIVEWREKAKKDDESFREKQQAARRAGTDPEAVQKDMPFADVCDRAAKTVFDIHWNLDTGIRYGSHEGGGYILTFADLDRLSNYLYMFTFDVRNEWRRDAEAARKAPTLDDLKPDVRSRLEPLFEKAKKNREEERKQHPDLKELTWNDFRRQMLYRARFRTEGEIGDAAAMAGYEFSKAMINTQEVTDKWVLDWYLDRLKPGESLIGMWGPHTYTFFRSQDKKIFLYDSWRGAVDERAPVPTFEAANSVHERGTPEYEDRVRNGLSGTDKPIKLLLGAAHRIQWD